MDLLLRVARSLGSVTSVADASTTSFRATDGPRGDCSRLRTHGRRHFSDFQSDRSRRVASKPIVVTQPVTQRGRSVTRLLPAGFGAVPTGFRRERIVSSPQFRDGRFENTKPVDSALKHGQFWSTTREYFFGAPGVERRPSRPLPVESPLPGWAVPPASGLRVTWLGHSTTLLEIDGLRILTDPVWGERISPVTFVGPRRFHPAPVPIEHLPRLDAILVSHDHFDH